MDGDQGGQRGGGGGAGGKKGRAAAGEGDSGVAELSNASAPVSDNDTRQQGVLHPNLAGGESGDSASGETKSDSDGGGSDRLSTSSGTVSIPSNPIQGTAASSNVSTGVIASPRLETVETEAPDLEETLVPLQATDEGGDGHPRQLVLPISPHPLRNRLQDLEGEVSEKKVEVDSIKKELGVVTGEKEVLEQRVKSLCGDIKRQERKLTGEFEEFKREKADEIQRLKNEIKEKEKRAQELVERMAHTEKELHDLKREREELRRQLQKAKSQAESNRKEAENSRKEAEVNNQKRKESVAEAERAKQNERKLSDEAKTERMKRQQVEERARTLERRCRDLNDELSNFRCSRTESNEADYTLYINIAIAYLLLAMLVVAVALYARLFK